MYFSNFSFANFINCFKKNLDFAPHFLTKKISRLIVQISPGPGQKNSGKPRPFLLLMHCTQSIYLYMMYMLLYVWEKHDFVHDMLCPHRFQIRAELLCGVFCPVLLFVNLILVGNGFNRSTNACTQHTQHTQQTHIYVLAVATCTHIHTVYGWVRSDFERCSFRCMHFYIILNLPQ